jgi:hypothetical protein
MICYFILIAATTLSLTLAWAVWRKTGSLDFPIGLALIYYWSLYGGWSIIQNKLDGDRVGNYSYLEDKMFPIALDAYYEHTLLLYTLFIVTVGVTILMMAQRRRHTAPQAPRILVAHGVVLASCAAALFCSFYIVRGNLGAAIALGRSAYDATRHVDESMGLWSVHQILNRVALFPAAIGLAVLCSGDEPRFIGSVNADVRLRFLYLMHLTGTFAFCFILGNKNELLAAGVGGTLFYIANARRPNTTGLIALGLAGLLALGLIDVYRGTPLPRLYQAVRTTDVDTLVSAIQVGKGSNEPYAAHMSMYGALAHSVPYTYGSSFVSLLASAVPRQLWPDRPADIYFHYVEHVGVVPGQGYTIHHATGWFLNFGVLGVVVGAILLGGSWSLSHNVRETLGSARSSWCFVLAAICPTMFTSYIPSLTRSGLESYKGLIVEAVLLPALVLVLARRTQKARQHKTTQATAVVLA